MFVRSQSRTLRKAIPGLWLLIALALITPAAASDKRIALVIGNGQYQSVGLLKNPRNDASGVATALQRLGFSDVKLSTDATQADMRQTLADFSRLARDADLAVIFYAGHGLGVAGESYVIPVDAQITRPRDAETQAVALRTLQAAIDDIKGTGVIILDACRNNPFVGLMTGPDDGVVPTSGLGRPTARSNSMIVYAARDGTTAADGTGTNSPFTAALLKSINEPLEIDFLFRQVRDDVIVQTGPSAPQEPFTYGSLGVKPVYLRPPPEPGKLQREPSLGEYRQQFQLAQLRPEWDARVQLFKKLLADGRPRYETVSQPTGVPWMVIGILHMLEANGNFNVHLHNGDPLTARTVQVPRGRPTEGQPPFTWEQSAVDALKFARWDVRAKLWTVEDTLSAFERYNGLGTRRRGTASPFLWSGSTLYDKGRFVADAQWDPNAKSQLTGAAVLLKYAIPIEQLERRLNYRGN